MRECARAGSLVRRALQRALPALAAVACAGPVLAGPPGFVWRIADISTSVVRDDELLAIGQYLLLAQALRPGESGWIEMKLDLPEHWHVTGVATQGEAVVLQVAQSPVAYALTRANVVRIGSRLLDGAGRRPDVDLASIWQEAAVPAVEGGPAVRQPGPAPTVTPAPASRLP